MASLAMLCSSLWGKQGERDQRGGFLAGGPGPSPEFRCEVWLLAPLRPCLEGRGGGGQFPCKVLGAVWYGRGRSIPPALTLSPLLSDQEMVAACTRTSNQQCQCKTGSFYCDSPDCTESCYRCRRCWGLGCGLPPAVFTVPDPKSPAVVETVQTHGQR